MKPEHIVKCFQNSGCFNMDDVLAQLTSPNYF